MTERIIAGSIILALAGGAIGEANCRAAATDGQIDVITEASGARAIGRVRAALNGAIGPQPTPAPLVTPNPTPIRYRDRLYSDAQVVFNTKVTYKPGLWYETYVPPDSDAEPKRVLLVMLPGGSFRGADPRDMRPYAVAFAARGYVVVTPNYTTWTTPPSMDDACKTTQADINDLISFLRTNKVAHYRFDPARIIPWGFSAGSMTAAWLEYKNDDVGLAPAGLGAVLLDGYNVTVNDLKAGDPPFIMFYTPSDRGGPRLGLQALLARATALGISYEATELQIRHVDMIHSATVINRVIDATATFLYEKVLAAPASAQPR